jgi:hypothetical protein
MLTSIQSLTPNYFYYMLLSFTGPLATCFGAHRFLIYLSLHNFKIVLRLRFYMTTDKWNKLYIFKQVHVIPVALYRLGITVYVTV